jgi:hypothetical protein
VDHGRVAGQEYPPARQVRMIRKRHVVGAPRPAAGGRRGALGREDSGSRSWYAGVPPNPRRTARQIGLCPGVPFLGRRRAIGGFTPL